MHGPFNQQFEVMQKSKELSMRPRILGKTEPKLLTNSTERMPNCQIVYNRIEAHIDDTVTELFSNNNLKVN